MRPKTLSPLSPPSLLAGLLACVLASGCAHAPLHSENTAREYPHPTPVLATTTSGQVRGITSEGVSVFKGIPYGGPTSGKNRFMPPTRPAPWTDVREATAFGPRCAQRGSIGAGLSRDVIAALITPDNHATSEDCLVLNVWTPQVDTSKRPVMVWLHGGGFVEGSGSAGLYDGSALVRRGDVVVVSLNHRLGALGYLHPGAAAGEPWASSGNAGMLDIVAALGWVHDNIASFGGDPGNVTIFGESGGGMKVTLLLAMPAARGLFHKAISESGALVRGLAPELAEEQARELLVELGLPPGDFAALQDVPVEKLLQAQNAVIEKHQNTGRFSLNTPFTPVVDGRALPNHPFEPAASPLSASVPLLLGTNQDEMTLFLYGMSGILTDGIARVGMKRIAGDDTDRLFAHYRQKLPEASPKDVLITAFSDMFRSATLLVAERKEEQHQAPVYVYLFTWKSPVLDGGLKAAHAMELPFVFDNADLTPGLTGRDPKRLELAAQMSATWIAFARSGNPNHPGLPQWPTYSPERHPTMVFDLPSRVEDNPGREEQLLWREALAR